MTLYTLYYPRLGGSSVQLDMYHNDKGVMLPPAMASETCEPYDLWTTEMLGVQPDSWLGRALTWPYRTYVAWRTGHKSRRHHGAIFILPWRLNVGGEPDVQHALGYTRRVLARLASNERVIMFGRSRGSFVGLRVFLRLTAEERHRVAFVLLEGAFHDSGVVMRRWWPRLGNMWLALAQWFTQWDPNTTTTIEMELERAGAMSETRIAVVGSRADTVVPLAQTEALHRLILRHLKPRICPCIVLDAATHSRYTTSPDPTDVVAYATLIQTLIRNS